MNKRESVVRRSQAMPQSGRQFSLRSLFVTFATIGMMLAYVRMFGPVAMQLMVFGYLFAVIFGGVLGWSQGRSVETLTWSLVGAALALCCVLTADRLTLFQQIYWVMVGAVGGAVAAYFTPASRHLQAFFMPFIWLVFGAFAITFDTWSGVFDFMLTLPVLVGLAALVALVQRLQHKYHTALDVWAAGLVFAVIAGNFGSMLVWNWLNR